MSGWHPGSTPKGRCHGLPEPRAQSWARCGITRCRHCLSGAHADLRASFGMSSVPPAPESATRTVPVGRVPILLAAIVVLFLLRAVASAVLPISADEAYYWLWSKHLSAGYLDHPPAIAFLIRLGTMLFGTTSIGVRYASLILSLLATWFVWRSATLLVGRE